MFKAIRQWWDDQFDDHEHDWGKWEPYEQDMGYFITSGAKKGTRMDYMETRQKRTCKTCGYTQDESI